MKKRRHISNVYSDLCGPALRTLNGFDFGSIFASQHFLSLIFHHKLYSRPQFSKCSFFNTPHHLMVDTANIYNFFIYLSLWFFQEIEPD